MTFEEAIVELKKGKAVKRDGYTYVINEGFLCYKIHGIFSVNYDCEIMLTEENIRATDWEIVDEDKDIQTTNWGIADE